MALNHGWTRPADTKTASRKPSSGCIVSWILHPMGFHAKCLLVSPAGVTASSACSACLSDDGVHRSGGSLWACALGTRVTKCVGISARPTAREPPDPRNRFPLGPCVRPAARHVEFSDRAPTQERSERTRGEGEGRLQPAALSTARVTRAGARRGRNVLRQASLQGGRQMACTCFIVHAPRPPYALG